jgi:chloramphenicol-sensitive protein RarD
LTFELLLIAPIFIVVMIMRSAGDTDISGDGSIITVVLIALTGLVTVVPLLLFATATKRVSLTVVGMFQYINPVMQFLIGWQLFGEDVTGPRLVGFAWIWIALVLVVTDELGSKGPVDGFEASGDQRFVRS